MCALVGRVACVRLSLSPDSIDRRDFSDSSVCRIYDLLTPSCHTCRGMEREREAKEAEGERESAGKKRSKEAARGKQVSSDL